MSGKNGCIEHNQVVHEIIRHAKNKNRTVHFTWFDLEDAFGSVPHDLIDYSFNRAVIPDNVKNYLLNLYGNISGKVSTKQWSSDSFHFKRGIFQGDPLSPIIFIMCFDPIIQFLETEMSRGYDIDGNKVITAPFADDFCLITGNKRTHQRLISKINSLTDTLGMKLKPAKCRSLSIIRGSPCNLPFQLGDNVIPSVETESHKFLGALITFNNKDSEMFDYVKQMLENGLTNINESPIRSEYKIRIYAQYLLPALRYHLTVNDMCVTHLQKLDALAERYLKKFFGIPHPGTMAFIHMPKGLAIKSISDMYREAHLSAHISSRVKGGPLVNHCLNTRLTREQSWTRKKSITHECETIFNYVNDSQSGFKTPNIGESDNVNNSIFKNVNTRTATSLKTIQNKAKSYLTDHVQNLWNSHVKTLLVQGRFFDLLAIETSCHHWKSIIYNLPSGILKFLVNALGDTLNTKTNLKRWGKASSDKCKACGNRETLHHVLNNCKRSLEQGRFTWRHNNILNYIVKTIRSGFANNDDSPQILTDLAARAPNTPGITTIPPECSITNLIPDICLFWKNLRRLVIIELTVPFEFGIEKAHLRKCNKYAPLVNDIKSSGCEVSLIALEIGSRGYISPENITRLKEILKLCNKPINFKQFRDNLSKLSVVSSFSIFHSKNEPTWINPPFLDV